MRNITHEFWCFVELVGRDKTLSTGDKIRQLPSYDVLSAIVEETVVSGERLGLDANDLFPYPPPEGSLPEGVQWDEVEGVYTFTDIEAVFNGVGEILSRFGKTIVHAVRLRHVTVCRAHILADLDISALTDDLESGLGFRNPSSFF